MPFQGMKMHPGVRFTANKHCRVAWCWENVVNFISFRGNTLTIAP